MRKFIRAVFWLLLLLPAIAGKAQQLTSNDVAVVIAQALTRANFFVTNGTTTNGVIAVVDREGFVLGAYSLKNNPSILDVVDAITKAGTAAFLSSAHNAFSSRTAGFIVQQHFPPAIENTPTGPLVGVNFSSLSFSDVNRFKNPHTANPALFPAGGSGTNGDPISTSPLLAPLSGLNGAPGGFPLFKEGVLVGGVGVTIKGKPPIPELYNIQQTPGGTYDVNEDVALAGENGYGPNPAYLANHVQINGLSLAYNYSTTKTAKALPLAQLPLGVVVTNADVPGTPPYTITNSPPVHYPALTLGGVPGELRAPIIPDPTPGTIRGAARLTVADVTEALKLAAQRAFTTRAGIRLPVPQYVRVFITVVNNPNTPGVAPMVLGTFKVNDATVFSWDVAIQKARTAWYFSSDQHAYSVRAVGFLAQQMYPPGIARSQPGPYYGYQESFSLLQAGIRNPLNQVELPMPNRMGGLPMPDVPVLSAPLPELPDGITIFPGGFPLYRNGVMIGAIGVSGDGVDQDDMIAASGTEKLLAPTKIRSDQIVFRGARLPYAKFPRDPTLYP